MIRFQVVAFVLACFLFGHVFAAIETYQFDSKQQEKDYKFLITELRCLVCQNQNLADSNAELAQDLRQKTYDMIKQGKNRDEIVEYMVARYGDFVMYRPPVKSTTVFLWAGPAIFLVIAMIILIRIMLVRRSRPDTGPVDNEMLKTARSLLDKEKS